MIRYEPPVRDMQFILEEVVGLDELRDSMPGIDFGPDLLGSMLTEHARFARDIAAPLNQSGDIEGCAFSDGNVRPPSGFKEAYQAYSQGGWIGIHAPGAFGGLGLPFVVGLPFMEMLTAANWSFNSYVGLTIHAITPIASFATDALKHAYLPRMVSGEWAATMNLTEPHCGSDLGLLRTQATPAEDGSYRISGTKIFITAGEHDLTANIVHLVLARIAGAPPGVRGISLFLVPKFLPGPDGDVGRRNGVRCARIEQKMGMHGSATCELVYEDAVGYLIGAPHQGLGPMFTMMNEARIGCGIQGHAIADIAYQNAVDYCRTRRQGKAVARPPGAASGPDPIIQHVDVRRMLLNMRSFSEAARALTYWCGLQSDLSQHHRDGDSRAASAAMLELLTPIVKSYASDRGLQAAIEGMQCFGGHGYIQGTGVEQFVRDARIAPIYEGTNTIQAMDLVGRKLLGGSSVGYDLLVQELANGITAQVPSSRLASLRAAVADSMHRLEEATGSIRHNAATDPELPSAVAHEYLQLFALVLMLFMWFRMAMVAEKAIIAGRDPDGFYADKLHLAEYFRATQAPMARLHLDRILGGSTATCALPVDSF